jgi:hypothetical protein
MPGRSVLAEIGAAESSAKRLGRLPHRAWRVAYENARRTHGVIASIELANECAERIVSGRNAEWQARMAASGCRRR